MIKRDNEYYFDVKNNTQIMVCYDWRNVLLDFRIRFHKRKMYHLNFEFCRFKIMYHDYGQIF